MKLQNRINYWLFSNTGYYQLITKGLDYKLDLVIEDGWSDVLSIYKRFK